MYTLTCLKVKIDHLLYQSISHFLNIKLFKDIIKLLYIPKFDNTLTMHEIKPTLLDIISKNLRHINYPSPKKKFVIWTISNYKK